MNFDKNKIGDLYVKSNQFFMICGFNYLEKEYILISLEKYFNHRNYVLLDDSYKKTTKKEIEIFFNREIEICEKIISLENKFIEKIAKQKYNNYKIEVSKIVNKYFELIYCIDETYQNISNKSIQENEDNYKKYNKILKENLKGLHRLKKRFYFYFGEESFYILNQLKNITKKEYYIAKYKKSEALQNSSNFKNNYQELEDLLKNYN